MTNRDYYDLDMARQINQLSELAQYTAESANTYSILADNIQFSPYINIDETHLYNAYSEYNTIINDLSQTVKIVSKDFEGYWYKSRKPLLPTTDELMEFLTTDN